MTIFYLIRQAFAPLEVTLRSNMLRWVLSRDQKSGSCSREHSSLGHPQLWALIKIGVSDTASQTCRQNNHEEYKPQWNIFSWKFPIYSSITIMCISYLGSIKFKKHSLYISNIFWQLVSDHFLIIFLLHSVFLRALQYYPPSRSSHRIAYQSSQEAI